MHFRQLHKDCKSPIKCKKTCPVCNMLVSDGEIVGQYEYEPGKFVIIDDKNFRYNIPMSTVKSIDIVDFIDIGQIDHIYCDKTYFIWPEDIGTKSYSFERFNESHKPSCDSKGYNKVKAGPYMCKSI
ncbi:Ku protein [Thermoanaerobacterium butyriciformans]|uniref:Ku protein n=1 Tax=Thermoanaerobacterium butyriciformans TaxID=1702242 RepID=UPI0027A251E6|nr:hypothetical protein PGH24_04205 [Thermoanaerobacterium thermosaccharolyticum]